MTQEHPITPPPELVNKLASSPGFWRERLVRAFQAGADFELEACVEWLINEGHEYEHIALQNDRRPKPPSLKEQAKFAAAVLRSPDETCSIAELQQHWRTICNALEQLND